MRNTRDSTAKLPPWAKSLFLLTLPFLGLSPCWAQCAALKPQPLAAAESIRLDYDSGILPQWVEKAVGFWSACANYGEDFPRFTPQGNGSPTIEIKYRSRSPNNRCAARRGSLITLFAFATNTKGEVVRCSSLSRNLAHELGHVLGLMDAPKKPSCHLHIMAGLNRNNYFRRRVTPEECRLVGRRWITPQESAQVDWGFLGPRSGIGGRIGL